MNLLTKIKNLFMIDDRSGQELAEDMFEEGYWTRTDEHGTYKLVENGLGGFTKKYINLEEEK